MVIHVYHGVSRCIAVYRCIALLRAVSRRITVSRYEALSQREGKYTQLDRSAIHLMYRHFIRFLLCIRMLYPAMYHTNVECIAIQISDVYICLYTVT